MWEIERCDWGSVRGIAGEGLLAKRWLVRLLEAEEPKVWAESLEWLEGFAANLGVPCSATSAPPSRDHQASGGGSC
jgi:hypothetical protein